VVVPSTQATAGSAPAPATARLIPEPSSVQPVDGVRFTLQPWSTITVPNDPAAAGVGKYLAKILRASTGYPMPVLHWPLLSGISLNLGGPATLGKEGYRLDVTRTHVRIQAHAAAGLFYGVQTLRQLLPAQIDSPTVRPGPWTIAGVRILDKPRFAWRGAMLDVARHFRDVADVKTFIDMLASYKMNTLHLHLSDNDGWRIDIKGWPRLARYGGSVGTGGSPGGWYTQAQYREIVRYASSRFITIIPEIDTPGHVTAALASYAPLNCDGKAPPLLSGGYSSLCVRKPITYSFLDDVIGQLAALTPGPYIHVGGDEALNTPPADYNYFIGRVQEIVHAHGKQLLGWHQIVSGDITAGTVAQYWGLAGSTEDITLAQRAKSLGAKLVMSPADKIYLDMKYDAQTPFGQDWAGYNSVSDAYDWDPATLVPGIGEGDISGVEAPLWTDVLPTMQDVEYMALPRLPGVAEVGWSPQSAHSWSDYKVRLAAQAPRWTERGWDYFRSPEVPWSD